MRAIWADRYSRKLIIVRSAYVEGVLFTVAAPARTSGRWQARNSSQALSSETLVSCSPC